MRRAQKALTDSTKKALREAGNTAKKTLTESGRRQAPSLRFRNMRGAKLGVRTKVTVTEVTVTPSGPWGILEPGAKAHKIASKRRGGAMQVAPGVWRRGPFRHPGTRNTRAWSTGQDATFDQLGKDVPKTIGDAVEDAFSG
jgi:hypothetical protein